MGQKDIMTQRLFPDAQRHLFEKSYQEQLEEEHNRTVECLGLSFANDEERRQHFLAILREKLKDPEFRKIEGFPIGSDEDILALSDPPYYTACPNPFMRDFIKHYGKPYDPNVQYGREPFAADVSEGKTDPIYNAHSYHTKVPYKAIMRYVLHFTEPGDIVLDGFCGTGMTGVASQLCGNKAVLESLGYRVDRDSAVLREESDDSGRNVWMAFSKLGARRSVLNDLSPAATFIAANYTSPIDAKAFKSEAARILNQIQFEIGWMYETLHTDAKNKGRINFTVWSDVFSCSVCGKDIVFGNEAYDETSGSVRETFPCPHCGVASTKSELSLLYESVFDKALGHAISLPKRVPTQINYTFNGGKYEKTPDTFDLELIKTISELPFPEQVPTLKLPDIQMLRVGRMKPARITHIHHFFLPRAAHALAAMWRMAVSCENPRVRRMLLFFVEQAIWGMSLLNRYSPTHFSQVNRALSGVFYIASQIAEVSPWYNLGGKLGRLVTAFEAWPASAGQTLITTEDLASLSLAPDSVDYVFTDPPFGENIYYSDLNILVESWHRVSTASKNEAIVDRVKEKTLLDYQRMMTNCFRNYYYLLKPGRWITIEFHNSKNSVWSAIQEALQAARFVIADVRTLDKGQGSYQQVTSGGAVKQDLVISAYRPNGGLEDRIQLESGTEDGVWDFIRTHLRQLPVFVSKDGQAEVIAERQNYLLFDRMVAFHVQRGVTVPLSAAEFYAGLEQRFPARDGMYFLSDQVAEYDKKRMTVREVLQLQLFVTDEASAIQWLNQQLLKKPQTFQEMHPQFLKELGGWQKHEVALELSQMLEQNFLRYDGRGEAPSQIHSYLSTNFRELRNLPKDDESLRFRGKDRWYVPDPNKAGDLEKLREKALLKEFEAYRTSSQKRLKVFRLEAVRAGFKKAWQERDYGTIIAVAQRIPESVLQEDPKLLMWYDQAVTRAGGE